MDGNTKDTLSSPLRRVKKSNLYYMYTGQDKEKNQPNGNFLLPFFIEN